eukprot:TRINITY_DN103_c0_g1_i1.p1 TRINITY_DN103_c0_g1~~TRINITY_DN103_c0_g1_i1.p1  ORF type:complete len:199 (+),score=39.51 TRINITY_DN103_c0_g1_i1:67-663(+)
MKCFHLFLLFCFISLVVEFSSAKHQENSFREDGDYSEGELKSVPLSSLVNGKKLNPGFSRFKGDKLRGSLRLPSDLRQVPPCHQLTPFQQRQQKLFQDQLRRLRKQVQREQPWGDWATKIISCSLGARLYATLPPEAQVRFIDDVKNILKSELKVRQREAGIDAMSRAPCHPFVKERAIMNTILAFRKTIMANACQKK